MNITINYLKFSNLLELARISAANGQCYAEQEKLIEICRDQGIPFLATMPMRHQFTCAECSLSQGESICHFENPKGNYAKATQPTMFGTPTGFWTTLNTRQLHQIFVHQQDAPESFLKVLSSVQSSNS